MWCAKCQNDVAVEARPNSQQLFCTNCGGEIRPRLSGIGPKLPVRPPDGTSGVIQGEGLTSGPAQPNVPLRPTGPVKRPEELLARWTAEKILDPFGPIVPTEKQPTARPAPSQPARPAESDQMPRLRLDSGSPEGWNEVPPPHHKPVTSRQHYESRRSLADVQLPPSYRADRPSRLRGPHFRALNHNRPTQSLNWIGRIGVALAYFGAITLTFGAGMVLVGYLGGPANYAPTGWFVTTFGQMLLFLGVVTLVSAGMEQTTVEVSRRIDTLGTQLERLEIASGTRDDTGLTEAELRAEIADLRRQLGQSE